MLYLKVEASVKRKDNLHLLFRDLSTINVHQWCHRKYVEQSQIEQDARRGAAREHERSLVSIHGGGVQNKE